MSLGHSGSPPGAAAAAPSSRQWDERNFRGRAAAVARICAWLAEPPAGGRPMVVTGAPGAGKSAVLGRVITTADGWDERAAAAAGSVGCAVHLRGRTAAEVAGEIALAVGSPTATPVDAVARVVHQRLSRRPGHRFNLVLDGLDEALTPVEARIVVTDLVLPIARTCAEVGAQVLVATRRRDHAGGLLDMFPDDVELIDLDAAVYSELADLAAYALVMLRLAGEGRPEDPQAAAAVAQRIAACAEGNFLVAGLVAHSHGRHGTTAVDPEILYFRPDVGSVLDSYLRQAARDGPPWTSQAVTALAHAQGPGLPLHLWQVAAGALGVDVAAEDLRRFAAGSAAGPLIESSDGPAYRLRHQALSDALLDTAHGAVERRAVAGALTTYGRHGGWAEADPYLLRALPVHAAQAGTLDALLADDEFLLHADLPHLLCVADRATTDAGQDRARLIRRTPAAATADPTRRAELFSVTAALEHLAPVRPDGHPVRYAARWAAIGPHVEYAVLGDGTAPMPAACAVPVAGRTLLASGNTDGTVQLWDPVTGRHERTLEGSTARVSALCAVPLAGRDLLASAHADGTMWLWDPATGRHERTLDGHPGWVSQLCAVPVDGGTLLASTGTDRTVRLSDPATGRDQRTIRHNTAGLPTLCAVPVEGRTLLASADADGTIWLTDPATGRHERTPEDQAPWVHAMCAVPVDGRTLLASGHGAGTVMLWDPATGLREGILHGHTDGVYAVCVVPVDGRTLLASAEGDGTVMLWDPATGEHERTVHHNTAGMLGRNGIFAVPAGGRTLLASFGGLRTVMLWDPSTSWHERTLRHHTDRVRAVCPVPVSGRVLLASAGNDCTVRLWDPPTGRLERTLEGHTNGVQAVCAVQVGGRTLLASAGSDRPVRLWDPATADLILTIPLHHQPLSLCPTGPVLVVGLQSGILAIEPRPQATAAM